MKGILKKIWVPALTLAIACAALVCKADLQTCRDACIPNAGSCEGQCGKDLAECVVDLRNGTCASTCAASARTAGAACQSAPNRFQCVLGVASTLGQCLGGCAEELRNGADACTTSAQNCRAACTTGSPSGAFIAD